MTALILASLVFFAIHLVPATGLRATLIRRIGERGYLAGFSLVSLVALALMAIAYGDATPAAALWSLGTFARLVLALLMIAPIALVVAGVATRNPAAVGGAATLEHDATPHGIFTVTRHPLMVGIALWAGLHILANPDLPSLVLFGTLAATALYGLRLQDRRKETEIGTAWRRFCAQTSVMPFRAVLEGRARLDLEGVGWSRLGVALLVWAAIVHGHGAIIGMPAVIY